MTTHDQELNDLSNRKTQEPEESVYEEIHDNPALKCDHSEPAAAAQSTNVYEQMSSSEEHQGDGNQTANVYAGLDSPQSPTYMNVPGEEQPK